MLFARRRWSIRIAEEMGLPISSPEATLLIRMTMWGAKRFTKKVHRDTGSWPRRTDEWLLITAMGLSANQTVVPELMGQLRLDRAAAESLQDRWGKAAFRLAKAHGFDELVVAAEQSGAAK